ncbi:MAG: InlB B-repeat-containing protein [Treponema sp.]|nr:InlB B-repeat-containing protein [Treponema sp.]
MINAGIFIIKRTVRNSSHNFIFKCVLLLIFSLLSITLFSCAGGAGGGSGAIEEGTALSVSIPASGVKALYEKDEIVSFSVTISSDSYAFSKTANRGETILFSDIPVDTYSVKAYGKTSDGNVAAKAETSVVIKAGETTSTTINLIRINYYRVRFLKNATAGDTTELGSQNVTEGYTAAKPAVPTVSGKIFSFWSTSSDSTVAEPFDFNTPISAETSLYAIWDSAIYDITWNSAIETSIVLPNTYDSNEGLALPALESDGYTFKGWYEDEACSDSKKVTSIAVGTKGVKTFWAKWTVNVTFDKCNGDAPHVVEVEYGNTVSILSSAPSKTGFSFDGWYTGTVDGDGTVTLSSTAYDFTDSGATVTVPFILYAKWKVTSFFEGTLSQFLATSFGTGSSRESPCIVKITDVTDSNVSQIGTRINGDETSGDMENVYISLDLSECTGLTTIPNSAFSGLSVVWNTNSTSSKQHSGSLVAITLPNTITSIENYAFFQSTELETVNIPEGVISIGKDAFNQADLKGELRLPSTLTTVGERAFNYLDGLTRVYAKTSLDLSASGLADGKIERY